MMMIEDYVIGVDVGGSKMLAARVAAQGRLSGAQEMATPRDCSPQELMRSIGQLARGVTVPATPPRALGVGLPGTVDCSSGQCWCAPNLGWRTVDAAEAWRSDLGLPVYLENDANAAAVAEHRLGAGQDYSHLLVITLGTGIGAGLILNGQLYRGAHGSAGELGHLPVAAQGHPCNCGNRGCLETVFSAPALARQATRAYGAPVSPRQLVERAQAGEASALALLEGATAELTRALVGVVNLLDLELIVLGGGLAQAGELIRRPIAEELMRRIMPRPGRPLEVRLAQCGPQAGVIGAGLVAWDGLLS